MPPRGIYLRRRAWRRTERRLGERLTALVYSLLPTAARSVPQRVGRVGRFETGRVAGGAVPAELEAGSAGHIVSDGKCRSVFKPSNHAVPAGRNEVPPDKPKSGPDPAGLYQS